MSRLAFVLMVAACGSSGSDQGALGEPCYPNGTCNVGLACAGGICVAADAPMGDASIDAPVDAPQFTCADDSALEPNDNTQTAFTTPVDTQQQMVSIANLAICPSSDQDHFRVTLSTPNQALEVVATWTEASPLVLSVLNAGGVAIANGTATGTNAVRTCVPNLPVGTYYARVAASAEENNYSLSIEVLATCN